jgi:hypothetical protein
VADTVTVCGYAATAAELLDAAAEDTGAGDLAVRQLAATQAVGYALLAIVDQLADLADAAADVSGQLGTVVGAGDVVAGILDPPEVLDPAAESAGVIAAFKRAFPGLWGGGSR